MCLNPDIIEDNKRCINSKKIYPYGATMKDCENYCSSINNNFLKPYIIRPKNIHTNNNLVAIYKPPYMNVNIGNNIISKENMMNIIIINKLINIFNSIKDKNEVKEEFIIFIEKFIKISNIIINIFNKSERVSSINIRNSELINKLIRLYNSYFHNKIDFPSDSNNIFIVYYIIVIEILIKLNKKIDKSKDYSGSNIESLNFIFNCITDNTDEINIEKEYAPYSFSDPTNLIGKRSIMNWILNNHFLNKFSISKDITKGYGICNRIDVDTSGIIICALNNNAYMDIMEQITNHTNVKIYTTLLNGQLQSKRIITNTIDRSLIKHNLGFEYNKLAEKNTNNHVTIIYPYIIYQDENDPESYYTLAFIRILSGIHHQIRLHCNSIGHSVVSDEVYNCIEPNNNFNKINKNLTICPRLFLHSTNYIIKLNDVEYNFFCNLPQDLKNSIDKLKIIKRMIPRGFKFNSTDYDINIKKLFYYLIKYNFFVYKLKFKK